MADDKIEETVCEDKISALPEDLLVKILLHVPIKDAIATMILSKRWRFIWTMLPNLEYDFFLDENYDDDDEGKKTSWCFFDKSMELHKAHVLNTLLIKLGTGCPSDIDVGKWIAKAVDRRVVVLKFKLSWSKGPISLPKSLYSCETLKELTLSHKVLLDLPSSSFLPSLEILELIYVVYKDNASLESFLSHCPYLNALTVKRNRRNIDDNITKFSVKIPSLLGFWYITDDIISPPPDEDEVVDTGKCLAIDTPALVYLSITDHSGDSFSIENMPCLENASIDVKSFSDIDKSKTYISSVRSLELYTTDQVAFNRDVIPCSWNQPSSIPGCLSSQLEFFEYTEYGGGEEEKEFVMYILANSKCLKRVRISVNPYLENKNLIIEELRDIPRASTFVEMIIVFDHA